MVAIGQDVAAPVAPEANPRPGADGLARLVLAAGLLSQVLLFLRLAVMFAPGMYLGPSGADRVFYYAYVRSIVFDGDLDFRNEMALLPPSSGLVERNGKPVNKYPIGAPLLSLPAFAATHVAMRAGASADPTHLLGYERPYVYAYVLSQLAFAGLGFVLLYCCLRRFFDPLSSAIGVTGAWLGTELLRYVSADLMMSHAAAFFVASWCFLEALRLREAPDRLGRWARLGAAAAMVVVVRLQNGIWLLVPLAAAIVAWRALPARPLGRLWQVFALASGGIAAGAPQFLVWRINFGTWVANSYSAETAFDWLHPHAAEVAALLLKWIPLLTLGLFVTTVVAIRRRDAVVGVLPVCMVASIYVTACWYSFGIAPRTTFDHLGVMAVGLAAVASAARRVRPGVEWAVLVLPAAWNVPFMMLQPRAYEGVGDILRDWFVGLSLLL